MTNIPFRHSQDPVSVMLPTEIYRIRTDSKILRYAESVSEPVQGDPAWITVNPEDPPVIVGPSTVWLDSDAATRGFFEELDAVTTGGGSGLPGADGTNGIDGTNGTDGADGVDGADGAAGTNGTNGVDGVDGAAGAGVSVGGSTGQMLSKASSTDFDTEWVDPPSGGGAVVDGGTTGQVLTKDSNTNGDVSWQSIPSAAIETLTAKTTVALNDLFILGDSAASFVGKQLSFGDLWSAIKAQFSADDHDHGTITSGTVTPEYTDGAFQRLVNNGAFVLAPSSSNVSVSLKVTNAGSAGVVDTSGFDKVTGDAQTQVDTDVFLYTIHTNSGSTMLDIVAL